MTYLLDGKQYVALMGGTGVPPARGAVAAPFAPPPGFQEPTAATAQRGLAPPPGTAVPAPARPRLYVFTLDAVEK